MRNLLAPALFTAIISAPAFAAENTIPSTPDIYHHAVKGITEEQAEMLVWKLPEVIAWDAYLKRVSKGTTQGSTHDWARDPERASNGKYYWSVDAAADDPDHVVTWTTFLVRVDGKEILVDMITGERMTLKQWRKNVKPLEEFKKD